MQRFILNASNWTDESDFYDALLPALGAPAWHGRNLNALWDSLSGGINDVEPPFRVEIAETNRAPAQLREFLTDVRHLFDEARTEFGTDVALELS